MMIQDAESSQMIGRFILRDSPSPTGRHFLLSFLSELADVCFNAPNC
jgi:hypothetical protein